jgi:hypothetical protein
MTVTNARILPATDLHYEIVRVAMTAAVGKTLPFRYPGAPEPLTATILDVNERDDWLEATFEITNEAAQALGLTDLDHYSIGERNDNGG